MPPRGESKSAARPVYFEIFTEVKFRDILLMVRPTLTKILNLNITSGSFVKDHLLFLLFTKSAGPPLGIAPPPLSGTCVFSLSMSTSPLTTLGSVSDSTWFIALR